MLILQAVPNSYVFDTLLPSFFVSGFQVALMSELPSFLPDMLSVNGKKTFPEMETFQHFLTAVRPKAQVSPPPHRLLPFFFFFLRFHHQLL